VATFLLLEFIASFAFLVLMTNLESMIIMIARVKTLEDGINYAGTMYKYLEYYLMYWWENKAVIVFDNAGFILPKLLTTIITPNLTFLLLIFKYREALSEWSPVKKTESLYGDAHWATEKEIKKIGLRVKEGVLLGKDKKGYLIAAGYQHILLFAPTGSGKGVGFAIPNCLFWKESLICHDIKLENFDFTSGYRANNMKQKVYVWSPADSDGISHCYNPMDWVSKKPGQMVDDVQKLANLLLPKRDFWENEARTLCVAVMLYLCAAPDKVASFGQVVRELRSDDFAYNMAVVLDTMGETLHPVAYMNLAAFLQKADKERSGVMSTMSSGLELWANPLIDVTTAKSDFNIQTFKKIPTTVFCGLTPDNIQRLKSLMAMFYQQATEFLSKRMPGKDEPYGVLFFMDEFPTLGKLEQFLAGIAYFRGYRVRLFLVVQDTQQLKGAYEDSGMNSFLSNATFRITFAANNIETAKLISELVGNTTVESTSYSKPKFLDFNPGARSQNVSGSQRALLLPQEVIALPKDDQIILIEASSPIRTKKIKYFEDGTFTKRLLKKSFVPTQKIVVGKPNKTAKKHEPKSDEGSSNAALPPS
jgi:type IV secretion system protein VirD4